MAVPRCRNWHELGISIEDHTAQRQEVASTQPRAAGVGVGVGLEGEGEAHPLSGASHKGCSRILWGSAGCPRRAAAPWRLTTRPSGVQGPNRNTRRWTVVGMASLSNLAAQQGASICCVGGKAINRTLAWHELVPLGGTLARDHMKARAASTCIPQPASSFCRIDSMRA